MFVEIEEVEGYVKEAMEEFLYSKFINSSQINKPIERKYRLVF